jgi:uncharacterized membrane protein
LNVTLLILRVTHILAGVIWVGGAVASVGFVNPTAKTLQQDSAKFMAHFNFVRRFPIWMGAAGALNVISGWWMYYRLFGDRIVFSNGYSAALTLGGILGLSALGMGLGMMLPMGKKLEALLKEIAAAGGPPSPEQGTQMSVMQEKLMRWAVMMTMLLILAVIAMSVYEVL